MKVSIIGGGLMGLFSAYYLVENGVEVEVFEKTDGEDGCSHGNAGMIVPSHFIPLAAPGMIEKGIKWMFDASSPFYVKPRLSLDLLRWGWHFYQSATAKKVAENSPVLRDLSLYSKALYQEISEKFAFSYEEKGLMILCKTEDAFHEEAEVAQMAHALGLEAKVLTTSQVHEYEPEIQPSVVGGVLYPGDAHLHPNTLIKVLKEHLLAKGVPFRTNQSVTDIVFAQNKVKQIVLNQSERVNIDHLLICTGAWSGQMAAKLGKTMPMQAGKGYSFTNTQIAGRKLNIPSILIEARVAITPMLSNLIRFGGTMELGATDSTISKNRVQGICSAVPKYFPDYQLDTPADIWHGFRPCSPDGLPYMGALAANVFVCTGHAMMGLSLAPAAGNLISQVILGQKTAISMLPFAPDRF